MNFKEMMINVYINNLGNIRREQFSALRKVYGRYNRFITKQNVYFGGLFVGFCFLFSFLIRHQLFTKD